MGERHISRSVALNKESITVVYLHIFNDANIAASCAVGHALVHQSSVTNQRLVVSNFRISKENFVIPRLKLET